MTHHRSIDVAWLVLVVLGVLACGSTPEAPAPQAAPIALAPRPPPSPPALESGCTADDDCVLAAYACCSAPPCDVSAFSVTELASLEERCARRACPPWEPRPCGAPPDPPSTLHAACVDHVCQAVP